MNIYQRVSELVENYKGKLTDQQIFTSPTYGSYIQKKAENIITGAFYTLRKEGFNASEYEEKRILSKLHTSMDFVPGGETAYTAVSMFDDKNIWINAACDLVELQTAREFKHCAVLGLLYHEIGHLLFTDFPTYNAWKYQVQAGVWFPEAPDGAKTVNGVNLTAKMKDPTFLSILVNCACHFQNAIEDGFIEREMKAMYSSRGAECINAMNCAMEEGLSSLEESLADPDTSEFSALFKQVLSYAIFEEVNIGNYNGPLLDPLYEVIDIMDKYCYERDPLQRVRAVNEILCTLFPYLDKEIEDTKRELQNQQNQQNQQQNGQTGSQQGNGSDNGSGSQQGSGSGNDPQQSGSGNLMQDVVNAINNAMNQTANSMNVSDASAYGNHSQAINNPSSVSNANAPKRQGPGNGSKGSASGTGAGGNGASNSGTSDLSAFAREINNLTNQIATANANRTAEEERTSEMNRENSVVSGQEYGLQNVSADISRAAEVEASNVAAYDEAMKTLGPISRDLQRGISRVLKERREGGKRKNLPFGRRLEVSSIVHNDGKYFSRNKLPTESPKLGVALLVDESGSTSGELIDAATRASLVIEDFCRELDIPHIISGYTTGRSSTHMISYAEPGTADGNDKYRITGMKARGGTPTKGALLYMLQRLRKLPVDVRLMIVITDGSSGDNNDPSVPYDCEPDKKPIRRIIRTAKRDGTIIVAAGIGSDRKAVKREFGDDNFMDITNLDLMPEQLISLIKENIWV